MSSPIVITLSKGTAIASYGDCLDMEALNIHTKGRKRRLDHLSWEEKLQRKKLKNRVAAQTSRDRKKAKMEDMEQTISELRAQNESLSQELVRLRKANRQLVEENAELREERSAGGVAGGESSTTIDRPAESERGPRQQGAALHLLLLALATLASSQRSKCSTSPPSSSLLRAFCKTWPQTQLNQLTHKHITQVREAAVRWWGPQQSSWNPARWSA